jgi:hypothetical protein
MLDPYDALGVRFGVKDVETGRDYFDSVAEKEDL